VYFLSLFFGLLLIFFVLISSLKFSQGKLFLGLFLFLISFLILSSFIGWVQKVESFNDKEDVEKKSKSRVFLKGRMS
jgi:hypothetical protein